MRFKKVNYTINDIDYSNVKIPINDTELLDIPAEVGNPNYDNFLLQANLTDEEIKLLEPDIWYDFPEEVN